MQRFIHRSYSIQHGTPLDKLRNFCIIAHVDHGKSTLADRLMELTGAIKPQPHHSTPTLDSLPVERARGITVKTQCVTMPYRQGHLLTLMDTPGHVDFGGEVSRAVVACQGAIVVVDATQGIQPQTINNIEKAKRVGVKAFLPVVNKIDLASADVNKACEALATILDKSVEQVIKISAKTGLNVETVLERVISDIPPPSAADEKSNNTDSVILDSWYDEYRGVVCLVSVLCGSVTANTHLFLASSKTRIDINEVGYLTPRPLPMPDLACGQIGYVVTGVKTIRSVKIGDHLISSLDQSTPQQTQIHLPKPTIFAGVFPKHNQDYHQLVKAVDKLLLNDASVTVEKAHSAVLGAGFRLGFLGTLHMDVFRERLNGEFAAETIITAPTVTFMVHYEHDQLEPLAVNSAAMFPEGNDLAKVRHIAEPVCRVTICCEDRSIGDVMALIGDSRGTDVVLDYDRAAHVRITCRVPLLEMIGDFYDRLLSITSGTCQFDYESDGNEPSEIVMVKVLLNGDPIDMLSFIAHSSSARQRALSLLSRLKSSLDRHQFEIVLQASVNNRIIARETLSAMRKDVTAKCYGGDGTRKKKLLEQQREGKAKLRQIGRVTIESEALCDLMRFK